MWMLYFFSKIVELQMNLLMIIFYSVKEPVYRESFIF